MSFIARQLARRVLTPTLSRAIKSNFSTSSVLLAPKIQNPAPDFAGTAVEKGEFKDIKLSDYAGKFVVLLFYPLDFTFVCPTELIAFSDKAAEFKKLGCEVIGVSTDSHFSHLAWTNTPRKDGGLGNMDIALLSDYNKKVSEDYGVLLDQGFALRGLFIIDSQGVLRHMSVNDLSVGRSVDETLRMVKAIQFADKHGEDGVVGAEVEARGRGTAPGLLDLQATLAAAPAHHWQHTTSLILKGLVFTTIILGALLGNALVIISVHRHRKLRVLTNYYVVSLAVADMLVALCAMTFNASAELTDTWLFGPVVCDIFNSLDVYFSSASILHLCCISVDRYYAIVRPLEYPVTMTHRTVCFMLANVWLWPAFISFVPIFMGWYTTEQHRQFKKAHPDICMFKVNQVYAIVSSSVSFWIPSVVMISMYCRIFREAIRQREALTRTSSNILLNSVHIKHTSHSAHHSHYLHPDRRPSDISPNYSTFTECQEETELGGDVVNMSVGDVCPSKEASPRKSVNISETASSGYCSGGSNKRSSSGQPPPGWRPSCTSTVANRDLAKAATELNSQGVSLRAAGKSWRAEHKAARTLGIIVGAFLLCWLPFFLWYVTTNVCGEPCETPNVVVGVLFWIGYFNSALNPLIYAYFNRDFRDAFKNTLMCALPCCFTCWKDTNTPHYL